MTTWIHNLTLLQIDSLLWFCYYSRYPFFVLALIFFLFAYIKLNHRPLILGTTFLFLSFSKSMIWNNIYNGPIRKNNTYLLEIHYEKSPIDYRQDIKSRLEIYNPKNGDVKIIRNSEELSVNELINLIESKPNFWQEASPYQENNRESTNLYLEEILSMKDQQNVSK